MKSRIRLTSDGQLKIKIPGRRSLLYNVPFYDAYRGRAFWTLRQVLERLPFRIVGEEEMKRSVNVDLEGERLNVKVNDRVLIAIFNPTPEYMKRYPGLKEPEYRVAFIYLGDGRFLMAFEHEEKEEYEAFKRIYDRVFTPLYLRAYITGGIEKKEITEEKTEVPKTEETPVQEGETEEATKSEKEGKEKIGKKPASKPSKKKEKHTHTSMTEPAIKEVKKNIERYKPKNLREQHAYERYLEALEASPERSEEIHKLFYKHINGEITLKEYYLELYNLAPKLLENFQLSLPP